MILEQLNLVSHLGAERGDNLLLACTKTGLVHLFWQLSSEEVCDWLLLQYCFALQDSQCAPSPLPAVLTQPHNTRGDYRQVKRMYELCLM